MNFDTLITDTTVDDVKARLLEIATSAGMKVTSWIKGSRADQFVSIVSQGIHAFTRVIIPAVRGNFLGLATDPGDPDPITGLVDASVTPAPGWLTSKGEGDYGTPRIEETFASGFVTLENTSADPYTFGPEELTFQNSGTGATFRNSSDDTLYPSPFFTFTLAPGATQDVPVEAEIAGTASNSTSGDIDTLVTTLPGVTVTNAEDVLGTDREDAATYRRRCRNAAAATSPGGASAAYDYIATSAREDGTFGNQESDAAALDITRTHVTDDSDTGAVVVWMAGAAGAISAEDFDIADDLITQNAVPDGVLYEGQIAVEQTVSVTATVTYQPGAGVTQAIVEAAAEAALEQLWQDVPVSGYDRDFITGGSIPLAKIVTTLGTSHAAIFNVSMSVPASPVLLDVGDVPVSGTITITAVAA